MINFLLFSPGGYSIFENCRHLLNMNIGGVVMKRDSEQVLQRDDTTCGVQSGFYDRSLQANPTECIFYVFKPDVSFPHVAMTTRRGRVDATGIIFTKYSCNVNVS